LYAIFMNPLKKLQDFGQSVYMDEIRRSLLDDGSLKDMIARDGLRGVTSNPAIFEKAIAGTSDYDSAIAKLAAKGKTVAEIYEDLVIEDIQRAADLFRHIYDDSDGRYGYVSLEVSPKLAHDSEGTIKEARHLWQRLARPNTFIKVPGTEAGIAAIEQLIAEGINVNVTLLFGLERYRQVALAYLTGLEKRLEHGQEISRVASVASFFLSRIDVMLDPRLEAKAPELKGKIALANAKMAYQIYLDLKATAQYQQLADKGARPQRLLWASTSTKDPSYSDVLYVEPLIGADTINTMPTDTLDAYRDHGDPAARIEQGLEEAQAQLARMADLGIDMDEVSRQLEDEGVNKFVKPFESLMATLEKAIQQASPSV
jgi:transaldolase